MAGEKRRRRILIIAGGLVALALLALLCIIGESGDIEDDLTSKVTSRLAAEGIDGVDVSLDGRDVTLRGVAGATVPDQAVRLAEDVDGVRVVDVDDEPGADTEPGEGQPSEEDVAEARDAVADLDLGAVEFDDRSAEITGRAAAVLDEAASVLGPLLEAESGLQLTVVGHTNPGGPAAEQALVDLSERRTQAVVDYLVDKGLPEAQLSAVGKGGSEPVVADPQTEADRAANRRVEFIIEE